MNYLDSNVFVFALLNPENDKKFIASRNVLEKIVKGELKAATSLLTWDEVFWAVKEKLGLNVAKAEGRKLLQFPNLRMLNVDDGVVGTAQEIAERYGLDPRDAIHAASCIESGIEKIVSDDADFDTVEGIKRIAL